MQPKCCTEMASIINNALQCLYLTFSREAIQAGFKKMNVETF